MLHEQWHNSNTKKKISSNANQRTQFISEIIYYFFVLSTYLVIEL